MLQGIGGGNPSGLRPRFFMVYQGALDEVRAGGRVEAVCEGGGRGGTPLLLWSLRLGIQMFCV